jgi:hypothetical protein
MNRVDTRRKDQRRQDRCKEKMLAVRSSHIPMNNKKRFISSRMSQGRSIRPEKRETICCGTSSMAKAHDRIPTQAMMKKSFPELMAESKMELRISLKLIFRKNTAPTTKAYSTATAAASVGVKAPKTIPATMITGMTSAMRASRRHLNRVTS